MRLFIFTAAGSCIADIVYEGSSGSIILDGYENDQYNTWQINSDCESLLFESTVFDTDIYDLLNFDEEGSERVKHSGDAKFVHTTNTGILTLSFASDFMGNSHDGFNINWRCSESNESDAPNLGCPDQFTELSAESCYRSQDGINSHSQAYSACVAMDAKLATIMIADSLIITGVSPIWVDDDINFMIACVEFVADEMKVGACDGAVGTVCVKDKIIVEEVDESDGSDESNVHEGSSGSISLNGYENNKNLYWQINSDCESIHFKSTVFDTDWDDFFYIDEEGSEQFELFEEQLNHITNTGNVQVSFVPDGNKHNDGDGFEIDWQCAESNESDDKTCMTGYEKDSTSTCIDINECAANDACPANQKCKNIDGSFTCSCEDGYAVGATVKDACGDINECAATEACPANQECKNADGSFTCSCLVGFAPGTTDEDACIDIPSGSTTITTTTNEIKSVIEVETTIPYNAELLDETSQIYIENAASVQQIFEGDMQKLASENEGLEFESIHVSFSDASSNRRKRSSEFATTSIETTFRTVEDAPADITASVKSLATSSIQNHGSDVISAETVPVVTTDIEVIEVVTIIALPVETFPCPSLTCWNYDNEAQKCSLIKSAGCVDLSGNHDGITAKFTNDVFATIKKDEEVFIPQTVNSKTKYDENISKFVINCEFNHCGLEYEVFETTLTATFWISQEKDKIEDLIVVASNGNSFNLIRADANIKLFFHVSYDTLITLTPQTYTVKSATVSGATTSNGHLDKGFKIEVSGSIFLGEKKTATIKWTYPIEGIEFNAVDCNVKLSDQAIGIVKSTCGSAALNVFRNNDVTDFANIFEFNFDSFAVSSALENMNQILTCSIKLCSRGAGCGVNDETECDSTAPAVFDYKKFDSKA